MKSSGSLADTLSFDGHFDGTSGWAIDSPGLNVELPQHCSRARQIFDHTHIDFLMELYTDLYKVSRSALVMSSRFQQYSGSLAKLNSKQFGTHKTRTAASSVAMEVWDSTYLGSSSTTPSTSTSMTAVRPVRINSFCKHSLSIDGQNTTHLI